MSPLHPVHFFELVFGRRCHAFGQRSRLAAVEGTKLISGTYLCCLTSEQPQARCGGRCTAAKYSNRRYRRWLSTAVDDLMTGALDRDGRPAEGSGAGAYARLLDRRTRG